ncbi:MAG: hypothetical protein ABI054_14210 [Planctomycetota bacterium]
MWIALSIYAVFAILTSGTVVSARIQGIKLSASALDTPRLARRDCSAVPGRLRTELAKLLLREFLWSLFPRAAQVLALGGVAQFPPLSEGRLWARARLLCWATGWLSWFGAGFFSLGHALE